VFYRPILASYIVGGISGTEAVSAMIRVLTAPLDGPNESDDSLNESDVTRVEFLQSHRIVLGQPNDRIHTFYNDLRERLDRSDNHGETKTNFIGFL